MRAPLLLIAACTSTARSEPPPKVEATYTMQQTTWAANVIRGVSGLAQGNGRFFAVAERERFIVPFTVTARGIGGAEGLPIAGVPEGLDLESLAALPDGRLAMGTEAKPEGRSEDTILFATIGDDRVTVTGKILFSYEPYNLRAEGNRGIEGLCFADDRMVAAAESVIAQNNARFAPIGSYDFVEKRWAAYRLRLTSTEGKISALACRKRESHREVFAIERHYGTMRVVRFTLPLLDTGGEIRAEVVVDLAKLLTGAPPNFEGIEILEDNRLLLISDNDHGSAGGPTHLVIVEPMPKTDNRIKPGAVLE